MKVTFLHKLPKKSQVKRLCTECWRLYAPGDISHNLKDYKCVCVGCVAREADTHSPPDPYDYDQQFQPRYEGVL